jgi:hypothetical protein
LQLNSQFPQGFWGARELQTGERIKEKWEVLPSHFHQANKKYMNMKHLEAALDDASIAG